MPASLSSYTTLSICYQISSFLQHKVDTNTCVNDEIF